MKPLTILIVDDLPTNRRLLRAQLESEDHVVVEAADGAQALSALETAPVDLIISDILMPVMDGYRLCDAVRRDPRFRALPFIFYTGTYTSPADEQLCIELGADRYLRKPIPVAEMLAAIEETLAAPRHQPAVAIDEQDVLKEYSERLIFKLEQKNLELAEVSSQLRLQATALDIGVDAILITDSAGIIAWVNRAFGKVSGIPPEAAAGLPVAQVDVGLEPAVFKQSFWDTHDARVWRGKAVRHHRDASVHYDEVTVTPVGAEDGTITHFVGVMHDVTDSTRAEEAMRTANERLRDLIEHSAAVIFALSIEGDTPKAGFTSDSITRILGYPTEETLNPDWWTIRLHPEDRRRAMANVTAAIEHGSSRVEYRLRHKDGTYRWFDDTMRLVRRAEGGPPEIIGVLTDVTERRRAQDELRESERRFQSMLANLQLIAMMLDREARIVYCNDHLLRLTGWTRNEVMGRSWFDLFIAAGQQEEVHETFAALFADVPEAWHHENEILTRSGKRLLIQWNNSVLRSVTGEVIGTASIGEDITERKNLMKQMLRAQRLESLGTLAGGIAHDLNNVLMPILMGVTLLKRLQPNARAGKTIENIERAVTRGSELVKQVLLFARGAEVSRSTVRLNTVIREVESIARSTFPKHIAIEVSVAADLKPVVADATQLSQVLLNLCVNARDAMPNGGHLSISASNAGLSDDFVLAHGGTSGGKYTVLDVTDSGHGISKETMELIFDPFFTTKEVGKGTGLGLATVHGIVTAHGGFMTVSSTIGEGSTFRVHLPSGTIDTAAVNGAEKPSPTLPQGNGELILVVDDDPTNVSMTTETLEAFGYRVVTAADGAQAIGQYSRHPDIALVLTDMGMPVIDGHALITALTGINPGVRIIAATGSTSATDMADIANTGAKHVLAKPYAADHLIQTVQLVLQNG